MILVCGEIGAFVAGIALRFVLEYVQAADLRGRHRVLVPGFVAIICRAARKNGPLEGCDGLCDFIDIQIPGPECREE